MTQSLGTTALVTGGATGTGRAVCRELAAKGVTQIAFSYHRSEDGVGPLKAELADLGVAVRCQRVDVRDPHQIEAFVSDAVADFGRLDHLVNAAGATKLIPFADLDALTEDVWRFMWETNVYSTLHAVRAAAPALKAARGSVVNIASISGHRAIGTSIPYSASKAALLGMTRTLALTLAPEVRVNSVSPGTISSSWLGSLVGEEKAQASFREEGAQIPLGRVASPEDIAEVVVAFLGLHCVTGSDIIVDGGKHMLYR
jgi:NAD(P)-dependent dehydrogenase (short-subunit alcohol dehydrogenase family)